MRRLRDNGVTLLFSGLKKQVLDVMAQTGLRQLIGEENIFAKEDMALDVVYPHVCEIDANTEFCLLRPKSDSA